MLISTTKHTYIFFICCCLYENHSPPIPKIFQDETLGPKVKMILSRSLEKFTSIESLVKIVRQLDFWYTQGNLLSESELLELTTNLAEKASILTTDFQCPKVRYGRTELQMPIVTCGSMRFQHSWCADNIALLLIPNMDRFLLKHASTDNLRNLVRLCLKMGMNHFETARGYGTSEYQLSHVLAEMIKTNEIQRDDIILQTKIRATATRQEFENKFAESWKHWEQFQYIDLLAFHCVSKAQQTEWVLKGCHDSCMAAALNLKKQGKVHFIGFSTHGPANHILKMINSNKFDFVNLHCHYMGSYHAEGTMDGVTGGHGNTYAVKRALELDMGVFNISPIDKGGAMYIPSKHLALTLGHQLTPIEFSLLTTWKHYGHHTASVGFARIVDLEDAIHAAYLFTQSNIDTILQDAMDRMKNRMKKQLGIEWYEKGLLNLPTCEENESTHGTAIGHVLWCYNILKSFGMYDFTYSRYNTLLSCPWNENKSFDENILQFDGGNMGRAYIPHVDYTKALSNHYNPSKALSNLQQVHEWMTNVELQNTKINNKTMTNNGDEDNDAIRCCRKAYGFDVAYDLRVWEDYPGYSESLSTWNIILQCVTYGMFGCGGGPKKSQSIMDEAIHTMKSLEQQEQQQIPLISNIYNDDDNNNKVEKDPQQQDPVQAAQ